MILLFMATIAWRKCLCISILELIYTTSSIETIALKKGWHKDAKSSQNHQQLKQGWHKDAKSWLNHWGIQEEAIMQNINSITNVITSKFKENMWCDK
jgi:hypothetical protein